MATSDAIEKNRNIGAQLQSILYITAQKRFWKIYFLYDFWCAQTFPPIFGLFAIFDRNLEKIVAPPSDERENYVAYLKVQSLPKNDPNLVDISI